MIEKFDLPESTKKCTEDFSKYNGDGTLLKKVQQRSLEIMVEFDKICRKHNIKYWLIGGSLIGAVRHNGFIPWDDDIDVAVEYKDIPKIRKALKSELPTKYVYQDWTTDKKYFLDSVVKIRDTKSYFPIEVYKGFKEQGLLIDIIPWERIPSVKMKKWILKVNKYPYLKKKELSIWGKTTHLLSGTIIAPFAQMAKSLMHFYSRISKSKMWGFSYTYVTHPYTFMRFNEDDIFPLKEAMFEGHVFYVPNNSINLLKDYFGSDVLYIPPSEKRTTHASNVFFYD